MRALYLIIGLLVGISFASVTGARVLDTVNDAWLLHFETHSIQMYHEGFKRGQAYGSARMLFTFGACFDELDALREIVHATIDSKIKTRVYEPN